MQTVISGRSLACKRDKNKNAPGSQLTLKKSNISTQGVNFLSQLISAVS